MALEVTPRREALSRSTVTKVSTPLSDWSPSMSVRALSCFRRSISLPLQVRRSLMLSPLSV